MPVFCNCRDPKTDYVCTLPAGHDGHHIATLRDETIIAVWQEDKWSPAPAMITLELRGHVALFLERVRDWYELPSGQDDAADPEGLIYLSCPYTHAQPEVSAARFAVANRVAAILMSRGHMIFSP